MAEQPTEYQGNTARTWVVVVLAFIILTPSFYGFLSKYGELIHTLASEAPDEGAFAAAPILNYLFASGGFLMLFIWAALNGMFRNIEAPKFKMLENERMLDENSRKPL